jgi:hypothetical protein
MDRVITTGTITSIDVITIVIATIAAVIAMDIVIVTAINIDVTTIVADVIAIINPAIEYVAFSRSVPACSKASKRRCSPPATSLGNPVCRQARFSLSF